MIGYLLGSGSDVSERWMARGCILFSPYHDTVRWVGDELVKRPEFAGLEIGLYAGSNRSGSWSAGRFQRCDRELLKARVRSGELKLLLGTDAASEGLNLQRLGTLINIDLPWNPTRLEQRKGRIQLFGQIPDTLEDVWVKIALQGEQEARQLIDRHHRHAQPLRRQVQQSRGRGLGDLFAGAGRAGSKGTTLAWVVVRPIALLRASAPLGQRSKQGSRASDGYAI